MRKQKGNKKQTVTWGVPNHRVAGAALLLACFLCTAAFTGCSKKDKPVDTSQTVQQPVQTPKVEAIEDKKPANNNQKSSRIKSAVMVPGTPRANTSVKVTIDIVPPLNDEEGESVAYIFYKNAEMMDEQETSFLPPNTFRKNDYIYADVILYKDGQEIDRKRSDLVYVLNSKPEIGEIDFPEIRGPGTYQIKINASDADNDELNFSLDETYGIPEGMTIDDSSGIIKYITPLTMEQTKEVKFKVIVSDGDGGDDWRELKITFSQATVREEKE